MKENYSKVTGILPLSQKDITQKLLWPIIVKNILTNDNRSTSPFPALGGKICVWCLWDILHEI